MATLRTGSTPVLALCWFNYSKDDEQQTKRHSIGDCNGTDHIRTAGNCSQSRAVWTAPWVFDSPLAISKDNDSDRPRRGQCGSRQGGPTMDCEGGSPYPPERRPSTDTSGRQATPSESTPRGSRGGRRLRPGAGTFGNRSGVYSSVHHAQLGRENGRSGTTRVDDWRGGSATGRTQVLSSQSSRISNAVPWLARVE